MNPSPVSSRLVSGLLAAALVAGCGAKDSSDPQATAAETNASPTAAEGVDPATATPTTVIAAARTQIKAGEIDQAAAKLAQLQASGASFSEQQAKDYRQALSEAYDRAYEAAQRGDSRAQAALQLLRAASPR